MVALSLAKLRRRGVTASGSSEPLLTALFHPVRTPPRFPGASAHSHRATCVSSTRLHFSPALGGRGTQRRHPQKGQASGSRRRVQAVTWSAWTAGDPEREGRTSAGSGRRDVCGGEVDLVTAPQGSGVTAGF